MDQVDQWSREDIYGPTQEPHVNRMGEQWTCRVDEYGAPIGNDEEDHARGESENQLLQSHDIVNLSYRHSPPMTDNEAARWLSALSVNKSVLSFSIGGNNCSRAFARVGQLLDLNRTLTALDIHGNDIGDVGCASLALGLRGVTGITDGNGQQQQANPNTTLTYVNLCWNKIGDEGMAKLANAILQNSSLTSVNLGHNVISWKSATILGGMLRENQVLTDLDLEYNDLRAVGAEAVGLSLNKPTGSVVAKLNLCGNDIGDKGVAELALALRLCHARGIQYSSLTDLNLGHNLISSLGMRSIGEILVSDENHITSIGLDGNHHVNSDVAFIARALKMNSTVTSIDLVSEPLPSQAAAEGSSGKRLALTASKSLSSMKMERGLEALKMNELDAGHTHKKGGGGAEAVGGTWEEMKARALAEAAGDSIDAKQDDDDALSFLQRHANKKKAKAAMQAAEDAAAGNSEQGLPGIGFSVGITVTEGQRPATPPSQSQSLMPQPNLFPSGLVPELEGTFVDVSKSVAELVASNRTLKHIRLRWPLPADQAGQSHHQLTELASVLQSNHTLTSLDLQLGMSGEKKQETGRDWRDDEAEKLPSPAVRSAEYQAMMKKLALNKLVDSLCGRLMSNDPTLQLVSLHEYVQQNAHGRTAMVPAQKLKGDGEGKTWSTNSEQEGVWEGLKRGQFEQEQRWQEEIKIREEVRGMRGARPPSTPPGERRGRLGSNSGSRAAAGGGLAVAALHVETARSHVARVIDACAMSEHMLELNLGSLELGKKVDRAFMLALWHHVRTHSALRTLSLAHNSLGPSTSPSALAEQMADVFTRKIVTRKENKCDDSEDALSSAHRGAPGMFIPRGTAAIISPDHVCYLTSIDLRGNKLSARCAEHLAEVLTSPSQSITHLDLRHNRLGDEGVTALCAGLEDGFRCAVISLQLESNMITDEGALELAGVFNKRRMGIKTDQQQVMRRSHTLTSIDLSDNRICDIGGSELAYALAHNPTLTSISLRNNVMGAEGQASWRTLGAQIQQQKEHVSIPVCVNDARTPVKPPTTELAMRTAASIGAERGRWRGYRYVRFVPVKLRQANVAEAVQTGRFWFWRHSLRRGSIEVHPVAIKNPGGHCPRGSGPENAIAGSGLGATDCVEHQVITKELLTRFYEKHDKGKSEAAIEAILQHTESVHLEASLKAKYGEGPIEYYELTAPRQGSGQWVDNEQSILIFDLGERNGDDDDDWGVDEDFSYRWSTAVDKPECDPVRWCVEGAHVPSSSTKHWHMLDDRTLLDYPTPVDRREYVTMQGQQEIRFDWHEFYQLGKEAEEKVRLEEMEVARLKAHADWHARVNGESGDTNKRHQKKKTGGAKGGPVHGAKALTVGSFSALVGPFNDADVSLEETLLEYPLPPCALLLEHCCWEPQIAYANPKLHRDLSSIEMDEYWREHGFAPESGQLQQLKARTKKREDDVLHYIESDAIVNATAAATAATAAAPGPGTTVDRIMHDSAPAATKIVKQSPQVAMAMAVAAAAVIPDKVTTASSMFLASPAKGNSLVIAPLEAASHRRRVAQALTKAPPRSQYLEQQLRAATGMGPGSSMNAKLQLSPLMSSAKLKELDFAVPRSPSIASASGRTYTSGIVGGASYQRGQITRSASTVSATGYAPPLSGARSRSVGSMVSKGGLGGMHTGHGSISAVRMSARETRTQSMSNMASFKASPQRDISAMGLRSSMGTQYNSKFSRVGKALYFSSYSGV
jgi:Ran GTPase-activating protein (RanGAP) involved in mRNA processing and transport